MSKIKNTLLCVWSYVVYHKKIKTPELKEIDVSKLTNKDELGQLLTNWQNNFDIE